MVDMTAERELSSKELADMFGDKVLLFQDGGLEAVLTADECRQVIERLQRWVDNNGV